MSQLDLFDDDPLATDDDAAVDELMDRLRHWHDDREPDRWLTDVPTGEYL